MISYVDIYVVVGTMLVIGYVSKTREHWSGARGALGPRWGIEREVAHPKCRVVSIYAGDIALPGVRKEEKERNGAIPELDTVVGRDTDGNIEKVMYGRNGVVSWYAGAIAVHAPRSPSCTHGRRNTYVYIIYI
uniref:Uncharacterized protein n=1 Tax=Amorphochlora amoebiformis TaxID=1561963 RepID=A0A7S0DMP7_9EUKA|mmetsp:Transcript_31231/g.50139  ORF Transcript_31231/g.50139 Transcript_31231/m.50139 type:complete len:133 (+) Transcript_31231:353-751(+)